MSSRRPTRASAEGRAYLDVQNAARRVGRDTAEYFVLYTLEGFLARLAASQHADAFILKGGALLAAFAARRPTRDIDFLAHGSTDVDDVLGRVREVSMIVDGMADSAQARWSPWRRKQRLEASTPSDFRTLLHSCIEFVDPVLTGSAEGLEWDGTAWIRR